MSPEEKMIVDLGAIFGAMHKCVVEDQAERRFRRASFVETAIRSFDIEVSAEHVRMILDQALGDVPDPGDLSEEDCAQAIVALRQGTADPALDKLRERLGSAGYLVDTETDG